MQYSVAPAKSIVAVSLLLISPVMLLFPPLLAIGIMSDIIHEIGYAPIALCLSGAVALYALYRQRYTD